MAEFSLMASVCKVKEMKSNLPYHLWMEIRR